MLQGPALRALGAVLTAAVAGVPTGELAPLLCLQSFPSKLPFKQSFPSSFACCAFKTSLQSLLPCCACSLSLSCHRTMALLECTSVWSGAVAIACDFMMRKTSAFVFGDITGHFLVEVEAGRPPLITLHMNRKLAGVSGALWLSDFALIIHITHGLCNICMAFHLPNANQHCDSSEKKSYTQATS